MTQSNLTKKINAKLVLFFTRVFRGGESWVYKIKTVLFLYALGLLVAIKTLFKRNEKHYYRRIAGSVLISLGTLSIHFEQCQCWQLWLGCLECWHPCFLQLHWFHWKIFSSHWHEKIVFSRQFIDVLNPFIGFQKLKKKYNIYHVNNLKSNLHITMK